MKRYPEIPRWANAPDLFEGGHLWLQEKIDGLHFRFRLDESGVVRFGDRERVFKPDAIPAHYQHAVRHVRERLDRDALRVAVDSPQSVVFFGEATTRQSIDYDWDRVPSFLGFDVWAGERFLPPDAVEKIFDRLGLAAVNTFQKEVRAADFDPESYEVPTSKWYDGPAEGVVVRNKTGGRATIIHPDFEGGEDTEGALAPPDELAHQLVTRRRMERVAERLADCSRLAVTFDALYERVLEGVTREEPELFTDESDLDGGAFRSEAAAIVQEFLDDRP